jgi:adenine-specific DNA-methyltransferase
LNGGQHFDGEGKKKDQVRDAFLRERGLQVLRFGNHQVMKNIEAVLEEILRMITKG